jgi:hypothetical protein
MRFYFTKLDRPKAVAKHLRKELAEHGISMNLASAQDWTARLHGYRDWKELTVLVGTQTPSIDDPLDGIETIVARDEYHQSVLGELIDDVIVVNRILYRIHPTSVHQWLPDQRAEDYEGCATVPPARRSSSSWSGRTKRPPAGHPPRARFSIGRSPSCVTRPGCSI